MKTPKLLKLSQKVISDEKYSHYKQKKCLKEIQLKLKKKAKKLEQKIETETNGKELKNLEKQKKVIFAQRKKIIKVLNSLK